MNLEISSELVYSLNFINTLLDIVLVTSTNFDVFYFPFHLVLYFITSSYELNVRSSPKFTC